MDYPLGQALLIMLILCIAGFILAIPFIQFCLALWHSYQIKKKQIEEMLKEEKERGLDNQS